MGRGIDFVQLEIAFTPFEIFFRKIDAGGPSTRFGGTDREAAGIGEGVQDLGAGSRTREQREIGGAF